MKSDICCIFNIAPHYNAPIYRLMDSELNCDFYFGDKVELQIKLMNYSELKGFKYVLKNINLYDNYYWQKNAVKLVFKPYNTYILTGEPHSLSTWLILLIANVIGKETILWTHGWYGNETLIKRIVKKVFFKLSSKILLYGNYAKFLMIKEGIKENKLITIYNSLDFDKQLEVRKSLSQTTVYEDYFSNKFPVLIYVGRIQKNKKLELLINALNILIKEGTSCNLIIIGNEVEKTDIQKLTEELGIREYVWFYGSCYEENLLGELIYNSDLCVVPGNIGLTVMHSFVYGTPVITHNNFPVHGPEFEAIKEGISGDYFKEDSLIDLSLKIKKWISLPIDKREQTRIQCQEIVSKNYNPHTQLKTLKEILKQG